MLVGLPASVRPAPVLIALALSPACQDEYPLEPTPCDYWCAALERPSCPQKDPAGCVVLCESDDYMPACEAQFKKVIECVGTLSDEQACNRAFWRCTGAVCSDGEPSCAKEWSDYGECRGY